MLRQYNKQKHQPKAEMNVVPYIDVMLVLLVIFMVTAPMLTQGIDVQLPKVASQAMPLDSDQQVLTLSVKADGSYYWNLGSEINVAKQTDSAVDLNEMTSKISRVVAARSDTKVYIRGDQEADYGDVIAGMAALQQGGVTHLGLITEMPE